MNSHMMSADMGNGQTVKYYSHSILQLFFEIPRWTSSLEKIYSISIIVSNLTLHIFQNPEVFSNHKALGRAEPARACPPREGAQRRAAPRGCALSGWERRGRAQGCPLLGVQAWLGGASFLGSA